MNAYGIISTFGVAVLLAAASVQCSKIHEGMTDAEIANIFYTTRDKMPDYDVALVRYNRYIKWKHHHLRMQFTAFGEQIDAYLNPSNGQLMGENTPIWLASTKPDGTVEYNKMRDGILEIVVSRFFTNITEFSTIAVTHMKGQNPSFNGIVSGLFVRPLPKSFQEEARSRRNSGAHNASRTMRDAHYHLIIKSTSVTEELKITRLERQIREASQSGNRTDDSRVKRSNPEVIYPSLLVQTDLKESNTTQNDPYYYDEIIYQMAFWNAVDLRFRHVNNPKIRLRISGIIIAQDRTAIPYMENHRSGNVVDMKEAWHEMEEYWYNMTKRKDFPPEAYDTVVTMTNSDMSDNGTAVLGKATVALCWPPSNNKFNAVAVVRDRGGFDGILAATHELGHILGLDHDQKSGDECDTSNGFIMQPSFESGPRNLEWSLCSLRRLSYYSRANLTYCHNEPREFQRLGHSIQTVLPGDVWGAHKQCQAQGYSWACDPKPEMCTQMQCYYTHWQILWKGWWCQNVGPPAEGTTCGPGHKCIDGVCQCMTEACIYINRPAGS